MVTGMAMDSGRAAGFPSVTSGDWHGFPDLVLTCASLDQGAGFLFMTDDANQIPATTAAPPASSTGAPSALPEARLTDDIIAALKTVYDPEIPSDIYELGLIYKIDIADDRAVSIEMTLTTPNWPSAQELPTLVET